MEKNVAKIVVGVVAGLAAVVLLLAWVGLIMNYATLDIGMSVVSGERPSEVAAFSQWMSLALFLLLIPFMAGCVLSAVSRRSSVRIVTLAAGALLFVLCAVGMGVVLGLAFDAEGELSSSAFTAATAYCATLAQVLVPVVLLSAGVTALLVLEGRRKRREANAAAVMSAPYAGYTEQNGGGQV